MEIVSAIIPTFNRFKYLLNTIKSIKQQTYLNIEIIVVNDGSTETNYYEYDWEKENVQIIHLEENTKKTFGFSNIGYVRNKGIEIATGSYIAFCDDDDIWFSCKIELQLLAIKETGCKMSSTDGLIGNGIYNENHTYPKYNAEHCFCTLQEIHRNKSSFMLDNGFPRIWTLEFLKIHNTIITSSILIETELCKQHFPLFTKSPPGEDYDAWLSLLEYTNNVYVSDICFYYDEGHGDGQNY